MNNQVDHTEANLMLELQNGTHNLKMKTKC
jgi:hypothetical protein